MDQSLQILTPASNYDILSLVTQIAALLLFARIFGEIATRLKQPSVIGEIFAGIFLGPSIMGHFYPDFARLIVPTTQAQGHLLQAISLIGVMFLLLITGMETDLNLIRRQAKAALGTALGGLIVPFVCGFLLGQWLPTELLVSEDHRFIFSLFIATALSISAIPVISKVLIEMKLIRRDIGQTIIAAGMIDDTIGWILLSIVAGLAGGHIVTAETVMGTVLKVFGFLLISFTLGKYLVRRIFNFVQDHAISQDRLLTLIVVFTFIWGALTQALHLEPILGAFVMGILLGQMPRVPAEVHNRLYSLAMGIFTPIFFAAVGLKVDLTKMMSLDLLSIAAVVIAVACFGKFVGAYFGSRFLGGKDVWTSLSFGAALNARGAMEIIIATIGLSLGILSQNMFSIIVLMALVTSFMAPFLLRFTLKRVVPSQDEIARLNKEEAFKDSLVENIHRILVPVRRREDEVIDMTHIIKSRLINLIGRSHKLSVTLLGIDHADKKSLNLKFLDIMARYFKDHELTKRFVEQKNIVRSILDESKKDYDMLVLGATLNDHSTEYVFSKTIDPLVSLTSCMTLIVNARGIPLSWTPKNILVPTNGSLASRYAAELAFLFASGQPDHQVLILNVIESNAINEEQSLNLNVLYNQERVHQNIVNEVKDVGKMRGVKTKVCLSIEHDLEKSVLTTIANEKVDLIVLGTNVRTASGRLFLGPRVESILKKSPCPVIILNSF